MAVIVRRFVGAEAAPQLPALARLRIEVFREWPYLYAGSLAYEEEYLKSYLEPRSLVAVALDGARVVGASTALPLSAHSESMLPALVAAGLPVEDVFYFGESVLLAAYRGQGVGHRFFDEREAFAREQGFGWAAFCAVERPLDHPRRPAQYVPHDIFWAKRGFVCHPELKVAFSWKDLADDVETEKPMVFWLKQLGAGV